MPKRKTLQDQSESSSDSGFDKPSKSSKQTAKKPAEYAPKQTTKTVKKPKIGAVEDNGESSNHAEARILTNAEGEKYVDLGKKRRATVRTFKGKVFLDIREYFGPDDDEKPGKKGISLALEQWDILKSNISAIDSFFAEKK
ncbi:transcriptional Coactivator p15-domain-containing protein [Scleroderma yunnanense]